MRSGLLLAAGMLALAGPPAFAQEPALPAGLGPARDEAQDKDAEPKEDADVSLPAGLGAPPSLPAGLGGEAGDEGARRDRGFAGGLPVNGFAEIRVGSRLEEDPFQDERLTLAEARLRLEAEQFFGGVTVRASGDILVDTLDDIDTDLERGEGAFDLRELYVAFRPFSFADVKAGRQVLTWGVGDLVFINDLFPKDFQSFFLGRDTEYLKAPSDAVRASFFSGIANLDVVYTPRHDPDRFITGERLSYFNPLALGLAGEDMPIDPALRDDWFGEDEIALRLFRQVGGFEVAAYAYDGFYKSPEGVDPVTFGFRFPELSVLGASLRGPALGGIISAEYGRYFSREDEDGTDPFTPNSDHRALVGFERELATDLTGGFQYVATIRSDQDAFEANLLPGLPELDRTRHLFTARLTKLAMNQTLTLGLFNFWSPNEHDGHLRLSASYKVTDAWTVSGGSNVFYGPQEDRPFSQLRENSSLYFALRRGF